MQFPLQTSFVSLSQGSKESHLLLLPLNSRREIPVVKHSWTLQPETQYALPQQIGSLCKINITQCKVHQKVAKKYISNEKSLFWIETGVKKSLCSAHIQKQFWHFAVTSVDTFHYFFFFKCLWICLHPCLKGIQYCEKMKKGNPCMLAPEFYMQVKRKKLFSMSLV